MIKDLIVYTRFKEICPPKTVQDMSFKELLNDTNVAFKIIGYTPNDFEKNVYKIYIDMNHQKLYDFIYDVWRVDNGY